MARHQRLSLKQSGKQYNINRFSYLLKDPQIINQPQTKNKPDINFSLFNCFKNSKCQETTIKQIDDQLHQKKQNSQLRNIHQKKLMASQQPLKKKTYYLNKNKQTAFQTPIKEDNSKSMELSTHYQSKSFSIYSYPNFLQTQQIQSEQGQLCKQLSRVNIQSRNQFEMPSTQQPIRKQQFKKMYEIGKEKNIYKPNQKQFQNQYKTIQIEMKTPTKKKLKLVSQFQNNFQNKRDKPQKYIIVKQQRVKTHEMSLKLSECRLQQSNQIMHNTNTRHTPLKSIKLKGKSSSKSFKCSNGSLND